tara:strand:- start:1468 stop:1620 length:153 start_codon:yes stop_codon:yes gene_type:complete
MGKGSRQRPTDTERFNLEFDRIFNKPKEDKADAVQESERQKEADKPASRD